MRYADYDRRINNEEDLNRFIKFFEKDIEDKKKELQEFIERANERITWLKKCEEENNFTILGRSFREGNKKSIMLIIRYKDGSQREEKYSFGKIADMRIKLQELKNKYCAVDWSQFDEEI